MKSVRIGCIVGLCWVILAGCSKDRTESESESEYSRSDYWLSIPSSIDKSVDLFYLYPTAWMRTRDTDPVICDIDNTTMLKYSALAFARQADVFKTEANLFAPYYRQVDALYLLTLPQEEQDSVIGGIPKQDVLEAFDYYIKHYNQGRPFILAGHSQGSNLLLYLLAEYMKQHPDVYDRMIAAYVIGYSVTNRYFSANPHLKFAAGPDDIGVIVSYNTEAPEVGQPGNPVLIEGAIAINPINWTRDETPASREQNLGSIQLNAHLCIVLDEDGEPVRIMNYADARINLSRGTVICSTANVDSLAPGSVLFGKGVYHSYDYPFYYFNIRKNAADRIAAYWSVH